jgi:AbrB family looped-hinge helix DNA binding protein
MRITSKGQVTIPIQIREKMGLLPETEVEFVIEGNTVRIKKAGAAGRRGGDLVARLRGRGQVRMTTNEIMKLTRG